MKQSGLLYLPTTGCPYSLILMDPIYMGVSLETFILLLDSFVYKTKEEKSRIGPLIVIVGR